jgi:TusA-related sulfurtransferase
LNKLIDLCVDICKRNGITALNFTGDKNGNLTMHKWFAATSCPGPYLESKFPYIASEVNKKLNASTPSTPATPTAPATGIKVGDIVNFAGGAVYTSSNAATAATTKPASRCKVTQVYNGKHPYHCISEDGKGVYGWVDAAAVGAGSATSAAPAAITVGCAVRITGTKYATGQTIPAWVKAKTHTVSQISGVKALLGANGGINSWVNLADLTRA